MEGSGNNPINNPNNNPKNNPNNNPNHNHNQQGFFAKNNNMLSKLIKKINFMKGKNNNNEDNENKDIENEEEIAKKKEQENIKREKELEDQIRDSLKCYICLGKVTKPKMCNYCKRICCEECINRWLQNHSFCGICKRHISPNEMITLPFLDDLSEFFIKNIDNPNRKYSTMIINTSSKNQNNMPGNQISKKDNNNIINNQINESSEISEVREKKICRKHPGNNCDYFCIHCNKYYCSQCLIFFGSEVNKHKDHLIVPLSKLNDLGVNEALNEYEKLFETRDKMNNVIGLCNLKAKENEIKKYEMIKLLNSLQNEFIKKIDEKSQEIKAALNSSINQKTYLEQNNLDNLLVNMFPNIFKNNNNNPQNNFNNNYNNNYNNFGNNFNNVLMNNYNNNNNYFQFFQTIRNLNQFENNFDITKKENTDINYK